MVEDSPRIIIPELYRNIQKRPKKSKHFEAVHPDSHRFMQDNDPKHTSKMGQNGAGQDSHMVEDSPRIIRPEPYRKHTEEAKKSLQFVCGK